MSAAKRAASEISSVSKKKRPVPKKLKSSSLSELQALDNDLDPANSEDAQALNHAAGSLMTM